jgi:SAM-dependent methyltransferase
VRPCPRPGGIPTASHPAIWRRWTSFISAGIPRRSGSRRPWPSARACACSTSARGSAGRRRHFARLGATVEGIDLTPEYVAAGQALTEASGLAHRVRLQVGDALALPFESGAFDAATLLHVGMNITNKAALFAEVARVVRPGGRFGLYDVMRVAEGDLPYPLPFAAGPETSFVERPESYRQLLTAAGFRMVSERDRSAFVLDLAAEARARIAAEGPPVLGMHLVVGPEAREMVGALVGCLERGMLAPVEMIAERG